MKKILSLLIIISLFFFLAVDVLATGIEQKKEELNQVGEEIDDAKQELSRVNQQQSSINAQLSAIEKDLAKKLAELKSVENHLVATQTDLDLTSKELKDVEENLLDTQEELEVVRLQLVAAIEEAENQEQLMAGRLRAMYMNSTASYLELLVESKSLNDLFTRVDMIKQLVEYDQQVFSSMKAHRAEVEEKKTLQEDKERQIQAYKDDVIDKKLALEQQEKSILSSKEKIIQQNKEIEVRRKERERLLAQLDREKAAIRKELDELEKLSKQLENKIQELIREAARKGNQGQFTGGVLSWPVPGFEGRISSPYGMRLHPISRDYRLHTGIDIAGVGINGKPAVAAADGVVLMAVWYGGYGNTVIIDHGGGITTLYAHGSRLRVKSGETVKRGQTVLSVGSTGNSTGPHLHFEVRKNGAPVDPMPYFKK